MTGDLLELTAAKLARHNAIRPTHSRRSLKRSALSDQTYSVGRALQLMVGTEDPMFSPTISAMTLLRRLARVPRPRQPPHIEYDEHRQINRVREQNGWVESWEATMLAGTKKDDHETGEDAKGQ